MTTRLISLSIDAYEHLSSARLWPDEPLSQVILRARWPEATITGDGILEHWRQHGPFLDDDGLDRIDALKQDARLPEDKGPGA